MIYTLNKKVININKMLIGILLIISLIICWNIPLKGVVSLPLFYVCFSLMLLSNYIFFNGKKKKNYLDFDTIFIFVYCLVGFSTTFFYYNSEIFTAVFLGFPVEEKYINYGNLLFLIGLQSYMLGSLTHINIKENVDEKLIIKTNFLVFFVFVLIVSFFVFGGVNYYRSAYNTDVKAQSGEVVKYILLLLVTSAMALIGTEFYNKKIYSNYKISWFAFTAMFCLIGILLFIGNRTAASQILLPIICLYALLFKNFNLKKFFIFIFIGIPFMWFFQQIRTNQASFELTNPIMIILDLTIPMKNTYTAVDYVQINDYTYGESMIYNISGAIPFLPSIISDNFPKIIEGSAELLTDYTYLNHNTPDEFQIGLGTTIVADVYIAFGVVGVVLFMFILGKYINILCLRSINLNYYSIIILTGFLGSAIFIVRGGYFHPFRFIIWALALASLNRYLHRAWKR